MNSVRLCCVIAACCLSSLAQAQIFHGRVDRVIDGDTLQVITEDDSIRVRIRGIDAPESDQEFGEEARLALDQLVNGRTVVLKSDETDAYDRSLASVAVSGTDVGLYMLEHGYAWFYEAYGLQIPEDWRKAYAMAESDAREHQIGLWHYEGAVPPWTWRKQKRDADKANQEEFRESLEGVSQELESNVKALGKNINDLQNEYFPGESSDSKDDARKTNDFDEPLSVWELIASIGEGVSRWIKAFILSLFV